MREGGRGFAGCGEAILYVVHTDRSGDANAMPLIPTNISGVQVEFHPMLSIRVIDVLLQVIRPGIAEDHVMQRIYL